MFSYSYTRDLVNNLYDINNVVRLDGSSNHIFVSTEVEAVLPGKTFKLVCDHGSAIFNFDEELSAGEKTILDGVVQTHKDNT